MSNESYEFSVNGVFYLDAPEDWTETEAGEINLSSSELSLPGGLTLKLDNLKSTSYEPISDKHTIKIISASDNIFYIGIPEESKTGHLFYLDKINKGIEEQSNRMTKEKALNLAKEKGKDLGAKFVSITKSVVNASIDAYAEHQAAQKKAEEERRSAEEDRRIAEEKAAIKLDLDAILYPEAPESFDNTEEGKVILNRTDLILPGNMKFPIDKLKSARYDKINDQNVIKITTTSENELFFSVPGSTKLQCVNYVETMTDAIQGYNAQTNDSVNSPSNTPSLSDAKNKLNEIQQKIVVPNSSKTNTDKRKSNKFILLGIGLLVVTIIIIVIVNANGSTTLKNIDWNNDDDISAIMKQRDDKKSPKDWLESRIEYCKTLGSLYCKAKDVPYSFVRAHVRPDKQMHLWLDVCMSGEPFHFTCLYLRDCESATNERVSYCMHEFNDVQKQERENYKEAQKYLRSKGYTKTEHTADPVRAYIEKEYFPKGSKHQ